MRNASWGDRLRYRFDNWMSKGTGAVLALLVLAVVFFVVAFGAITWLVVKYVAPDSGAADPGDAPWDYLWDVLIGTLFPGGTGSDVGWGLRLLLFVIAVVGLLFGASLVGIITGGFQRRIDELRKGRSRVILGGHTVILGWNAKVFTIIGELAEANASRRGAAIVILAANDKVAMEDEIRERVGKVRGTKIVCRTGDIRRRSDLEMVSIDLARSVILLGEAGPDRDNETIKSAFALTHRPEAEAAAAPHVVAELASERKLGVARVAGGRRVQWLLGPDLIGRILVQTCRQAGLSGVYQDLLDFAGDEIYFTRHAELVGATYLDAQRAFPRCTAIGLVRDGQPRLNPAHDTVIRPEDEIIVIAEDDSRIALEPPTDVDLSAIVTARPADPPPEHILILGGCERLQVMLRELDGLVAPGSSVHVMSAGELPEMFPLTRITITIQQRDPTDGAVIDALDLTAFDHVIVMPEVDTFPPARAESRTLVTLLLLHDAMSRQDLDLNIVAEMLDDANRELAEAAGVKDFIVSDRLVALAMAQLSENPQLRRVFADLFDAEGAEIYLRPARHYIHLGVDVPFAVLIEAARRHGETAIGYRSSTGGRTSTPREGIHLNPAKDAIHAFGPHDCLIVLGAGQSERR